MGGKLMKNKIRKTGKGYEKRSETKEKTREEKSCGK